MNVYKRITPVIVILLLTVLFAGLATVPVVAQTGTAWHTTTVDTGGVGTYSSLALDSAGRPHISYADVTNYALKYAWFDGTAWHTTTVDSGYVGQYTSLALDSAGRPHISYWYFYGDGALKYATFDGTAWQTTTVDSGNVGYFTSLALDATGYPHISYYDYGNGALKYASLDGTTWHTMTVDTGNVGEFTSLALDSAGRPHISYFDRGNHALKYASALIPTTLTASANPTTVVINTPFTLTGTLTTDGTPVAGATIQLQKNVGGTWKDVPLKTGTTSTTGAYSISTSELAADTYQYRTTYAGNDKYGGTSSTIVSVKVVSKASVQQDIATLGTTVNNLPAAAFKNKNSQTPLNNKLDAVSKAVSAGDYATALDQLQNDILKKTDGCASPLKQPDNNDWITTCPAQATVYSDVNYIIQEVMALQGS